MVLQIVPERKVNDVTHALVHPPVELASLRIEAGGQVVGEMHAVVVVAIVLIGLAIFLFRHFAGGIFATNDLEIDEAELGLGDQKLKLKPNYLDRQVAYKIWVELSTRKIGLPIDLKNDVVAEIYDSWFNFFQITRELIKDVPVSKIKNKSTQSIIQISVDVLNNGLRPHLTKWQARFRRWYEKQLDRDENVELNPQDIQEKFAEFAELSADLLEINTRLAMYRDKMREIVLGKQASSSVLQGLEANSEARLAASNLRLGVRRLFSKLSVLPFTP